MGAFFALPAPLAPSSLQVLAGGLTRASIPTLAFPASQASFRTADNATWVRGTSAGPMAIQDAVGRWWQITLTDFVNVVWFGAVGDDATQDGPAFAAAAGFANSLNLPLYVPSGTYLVNQQVPLLTSLIGAGEQSTLLHITTFNGSLFLIDVNVTSVQRNLYRGFTARCEINAPGSSYTSTAVFEVAGDSVSYFQYNRFEDITQQGFFCLTKVTKGNTNGPFGFEAKYSCNTHINITNTGWSNAGRYGWWFLTGSGTANVFAQIAGSPGVNYDGKGDTDPLAAHIRYEGKDPSGNSAVVGDITIVNSQLQAPNKIVSVGPGSVYNDNICFPGCQFDGGGNPLCYDDASGVQPQGIHILGANIGGGIGIAAGLGRPVQQSIIHDRGAGEWLAGNTKGGVTPGPILQAVFNIELAAGSGVLIELSAQGTIGGAGGAIATDRWQITQNGAGSYVVRSLEPRFVNSDGTNESLASAVPQLFFSSSVASGMVVVSLSFTGDGKNVTSAEAQLRVMGGIVSVFRV